MGQTGVLFLNDRDVLTDFALTVGDLSGLLGILGSAGRDIPLLDGSEMQGAIVDPRLIRRKPGAASVAGVIKTASPALAMAALDALRGTVGLGHVAVRTGYAADRYFLALCDVFDGGPEAIGIINGNVAVTLRFTIPSAVALRMQPDGYALSTTKVACPIGTAESRPVILVHGGGGTLTNPVITVRNAAGDVVQTMSFTVSLGANDALRIDSARAQVSKIASGTISDALQAGYWPPGSGDFPVLRPYDGFVESALYPTIELSSSAGVPVGEISYTRRYG